MQNYLFSVLCLFYGLYNIGRLDVIVVWKY